MAAAKDGNTGHYRPETAVTEPDDAVDDANDVCLLNFDISQWAGSLLGDFKYYQNRYSVFFHGVGSFSSSFGSEANCQRQKV